MSKEIMRPVDDSTWLESDLCGSFSALILLAGWQEGYPAHKTGHLSPEVLFCNK